MPAPVIEDAILRTLHSDPTVKVYVASSALNGKPVRLSLCAEGFDPEGRGTFERSLARARAFMPAIVFDSDGSITFYHDDGDLFWGHCMQIVMDANDRFVGAGIPG